jgi:hypothetical protein
VNVQTRFHAPSSGLLACSVKAALDGLALGDAASWSWWRLPPLFQSGVRFQYEPGHGSGNEEFAAPPDTYARGWGDCDDLVRYRVAELLAAALPKDFRSLEERAQKRALDRVWQAMAAGRIASTHALWQGDALHVAVRLPGNRIEDPSLILGAKAV